MAPEICKSDFTGVFFHKHFKHRYIEPPPFGFGYVRVAQKPIGGKSTLVRHQDINRTKCKMDKV